MKVVELGGGENPRYRPNVDIRRLPTVDVIADFEKPLPLPSDEFDLVYSAYTIEHISWRRVKQFISEIYRILKPGGRAEIITANLLEQCRLIANSREWDEKFSCMIFGDQDYPENVHKCGFSPEYAARLFREAGFSRVEVKPHPNCSTDMIIIAYKEPDEAIFDRSYFEDGTSGYTLYRDFPVNYLVVEEVLRRKPESVLELGCARGYIVKRLNDLGIKAVGIDVSRHCWHTRATDNIIIADATRTPWPFKDKEFDLCLSKDFMEHIPESKLPSLIREMARVCRRGMHYITFQDHPHAFDDKTHRTLKPKEWWVQLFRENAPDFPVEILSHSELEKQLVEVPESDGLVKLNIGCFIDMFHYGWINIDIQDLSEFARQNGYVFRQLDVTKGLPYDDNSVDIIYTSHFLEHLTREEGLSFLKECFRVLKPNGIIRIAVPDARLLCQKYLSGEIMEYRHVNVGVEGAKDGAEALFHLLLAGHKTIYDFEALKVALEKAGFKDVRQMPPFKSQSAVIERQTISMYPTLSLYVEARPNKAEAEPTPKTRAKPREEAGRRLKVGLISTQFFGVPPKGYSGLEMVLWNLACALSKLGHEVTLFAPEGSMAPPGGRLVVTGPAYHAVNVDWLEVERKAYEVYGDKLSDFDIVHGHNWFGFEYAAKARNPGLKVCHTHHGHLNLEWWRRSPPPFKLNLIAISDWMRRVYEAQGFRAKYVYNGIDLERYPFKREKGDSLLFVGRIDRFKQPHIAIEVAKRLDMELDIVGGTFVQDPSYLESIRRMCDGKRIRFHPDAPHELKVKLMQDAKCLLFTSCMGEPFGLVAVEAMACGTPVIALNDGAIDEVVKEGGIVCDVYDKSITANGPVYRAKADPVEEICKAISRIESIRPEECRRNAERFSKEAMAEAYERLYMQIIGGDEW